MANPSGPTPPETESSAFEALWIHVLQHWNDAKAHAAFLEHCQEHDRLLPAARRYREQGADPKHEVEAERQLRAIAVLAMARMERSRTTPSGARRQAGRLVALIFLVAATTALLLFYGLR